METVVFLISAVVISLSGVMAPGAVTAATIAHGTRRPNAGLLVAVGHGIIEFPLMFMIVLGFDTVIRSPRIQIAIGLTGGLFLLWMGISMIRTIRSQTADVAASYKSGPVLTGLVISASNPYFLLWWAVVGLKLAADAIGIGWLAFILFAVIHWMCDAVWLGILGWASFRGSTIFGPKAQRIVPAVCGAAMILFAIKFIGGAAYSAVQMLRA